MDTRTALDRESQRFELQPDAFDRLLRRRDRKERNRRVSAAVLAIFLTLLSITGLMRAFRSLERPASEPTPKPPGIFSEVGGWIAYGNQRGIWAVDPSHPKSQVQLSSNGGIPLTWSSDGSELLISRGPTLLHSSRRHLLRWKEAPASRRGLFVLHADGTETHLVRDVVRGASFSPDGTTVVFAPEFAFYKWLAHLDPGIYWIDADGGAPRLLDAASRGYGLSYPTFSPDGTQIAYIDERLGDSGNSLRVMNPDGSDAHVLGVEGSFGRHPVAGTIGLSWSPDGTRLAVGVVYPEPGIYVVDPDGSGPTLTIPDGVNPYWSPDGLRISFEYYGAGKSVFLIADRDGTHVQNGGYYATSGPWNPLVQPEPGVAEVPAASEGLTLTWALVLMGALLTLVVGVLVIRRRMGRDAGNAI